MGKRKEGEALAPLLTIVASSMAPVNPLNHQCCLWLRVEALQEEL